MFIQGHTEPSASPPATAAAAEGTWSSTISEPLSPNVERAFPATPPSAAAKDDAEENKPPIDMTGCREP